MDMSQRSSEVLLYLIAIFLPIQWLPSINPDLIYYLFKILLVLFVFVEFLRVIQNGQYAVLTSWSIVFAVFLFIGVLALSRFVFLSIILNIMFFMSVVNFVYEGGKIKPIILFFIFWMTLLSLFSLIVTYSPLSGFKLGTPLHPGYRSPIERWPGSNIEMNSFGFFGTRSIYTLTSISFVFAMVYSLTTRSIKYWLMSTVLIAQIVNIIYLTGSGRAGLVLPFFLVASILLKKFRVSKLLPVLVVSPIFIWVIIWIYKGYIGFGDLLSTLNEFMTGRLLLYLEAITVLVSNPQSLIGWGLSPWDNYTLIELGVTPTGSRTILTRPHNFFLEFSLEYGLIAGILLIITLIICLKKVSHILRETKDPTKMAAVIVVAGIIFTGLSVGGKMGPFSVEGRANIFWWTALAYLIGSSVDRQKPNTA